jgi:hypothetical protein
MNDSLIRITGRNPDSRNVGNVERAKDVLTRSESSDYEPVGP